MSKTRNDQVLKSDLENDLIEKVEPVLESMDYALRDIEVIGNQNPVIRVTIDRPLKSETRDHIGIEDCETVHRKLGPMFDVWDPVSGPYTLELSSPGEAAPLRTLEHFSEALGGQLKFQSEEAIELPSPHKPRKKWKGQLHKVLSDQGAIVLLDEIGEHNIPLRIVKNAHWLRQWDTKKKQER